jgi:hypothetical protein
LKEETPIVFTEDTTSYEHRFSFLQRQSYFWLYFQCSYNYLALLKKMPRSKYFHTSLTKIKQT